MAVTAMTHGKPSVDEASLSTTRIVLLKASKPQTIGTGFYYMRPEGQGKVILFLVTNHHVLTGFAPSDSKAPLGDEIVFWCHKSVERLQDVEEHHLRLYNAKGRPLWVSSTSAPDADIAVLPLPGNLGSGCKIVALTPETNSHASMPLLRPSSPVALVGYPYGFFDQQNHLPIWKTGAIASEPNTDFGGRPVMLVAVSAFPGMSGSPVYAVTAGAYEVEEGAIAAGQTRSFIGIFSAMRTLEETKLVETLQAAPQLAVRLQQSLELGYVWKERLIREIVQSFDAVKYQAEVLGVR
jgi:hypothetical protein